MTLLQWSNVPLSVGRLSVDRPLGRSNGGVAIVVADDGVFVFILTIFVSVAILAQVKVRCVVTIVYRTTNLEQIGPKS